MNLNQDATAREELGLLAVMDALAEEQQVTQRELSRRTGLNLKKVNYCLHKLLEKGHVKFHRAISNPDKRGYFYILTPAGLKAKSHLTYRFLKYTLEFYNQIEARLCRCLHTMARAGVKKIVICGASDAVRVVLEQVDQYGIEVVGVLDDRLPGGTFEGLKVLGDGDLEGADWDGILITALEELDAIDLKLRNMSLPEERIWRIS